MAKTKLIDDIEEAIKDVIERHIAEKHWGEIEEFRLNMQEKITATAEQYAKFYSRQLIDQLSELQKKKGKT
jgi:hypothetical protein